MCFLNIITAADPTELSLTSSLLEGINWQAVCVLTDRKATKQTLNF
jgi:hypothetical protein